MIKLKRLSDQPVLRPNPNNPWERDAVFNCAAVVDRGLFHVFYRAARCERGDFASGPFVSSIGYAVSTDGLQFYRFDRPVYTGDGPEEGWGAEDPRITLHEGRYYMMYTGVAGKQLDGSFRHRICLASTTNFIQWQRHGVMLDENNKDAALLPEKVRGRFMMFHRRPPSIWVAFSNDLVTWTDHTPIMNPIPGTWESEKIGIAGPPLRTKDGWFLIYHGVDSKLTYRLGAALLDPDNPTKVLARQQEPILEPELPWERQGLVPNVVFACSLVERDGTYYVFYGGADTVIGVAAVAAEDVAF